MLLFQKEPIDPAEESDPDVSTSLEHRLRGHGLNGYTKSSVEAYVDQLNDSAEQMQQNMEKQIRDMSTECLRVSKENSVLRAQISQLENARVRAEKASENGLKEKDFRIAELESEVLSLRNQSAELQDKLDKASTGFVPGGEGTDEVVNAMLEEMQKQLRAFEQMKGSYLQIQEQCSELVKKNEELSRQMDELKAKNDRFTRMFAELRSVIEEADSPQQKAFVPAKSVISYSPVSTAENPALKKAREITRLFEAQ